ncbi:Cu-Zn family superoxide dismutase [Spinactinospora alkalitolerans]|uniref:Cu-Zn family superoxide dismutase n=1 Tax=Spinactinospora alkalitolerans TaxID=687207 RepID=A0A852TNM9_9ACTN|nr:superoxide dismutase family protein [Spinactinospora alkalitolerans]NYE45041.1 Cu-Zn family superoxide dismutase [Spinactinospora alkalitolerans]
MRTNRAVTALSLSALLLAGCGGAPTPMEEEQEESPEMQEDPFQQGDEPATADSPTASPEVSATFQPYEEGVTAVTYDEAVPEGAQVDVSVSNEGDDSTTFRLQVSGLEPDREYGAHVHTEPCGEQPDDSGPHYQDEVDPEQPSTNPEYANPDNEVWLDFTTDAEGNATSDATVNWEPRSDEANSVVIHTEHTMTEPGMAGQAGDRLACVNLPM